MATEREKIEQINKVKFAHPENGEEVVALYFWSRDCDGTEGDCVTLIKATLQDITDAIKDYEDSAEGPTRVGFMTKEEYEEFYPSIRNIYEEAAGY